MTKKMNPEIKAQWIAALRSGDYKQGRGSLRSADSYCCLGVLCEIAAQECMVTVSSCLCGCGAAMYDGEMGVLSYAVVQWAGISQSGALPPNNGHGFNLVDLNDSERYTFNQIADVIEEHF